MEEMLQFAVNGTPGSGFLARPNDADQHPAVVIIQEWWGLNEQIKGVARRYAEAGYVALAPDLYHGKIVSEPNEAQKMLMSLDRERAVKEIVGAIHWLHEQAFVSPKKIGLTGYCMGGGLTLIGMTATPEVGAVVAYYPGLSAPPEAYRTNRAPLLMLMAEHDEWANNNVKNLEAALQQMNIDFTRETVTYPHTEHAFCNERRPEVYNADACADAWTRTMNWFQKYLV
jgi:carboxymethylenebutenolidase